MGKSLSYDDILRETDEMDGDLYTPSTLTRERYLATMHKIQQVKLEVEQLIGEELLADGSVQDASFMEQLGIYCHFETAEIPNGFQAPILAIVFSNFANLTTIVGYDSQLLEQYPLEGIKDILTSHGFVYIPVDVLQKPYDGRHKIGESDFTFTWVHRFFSYV